MAEARPRKEHVYETISTSRQIMAERATKVRQRKSVRDGHLE